MASPSVRATQTNGGDGHTPGLSTPSASSSRATQAMTPTTPSNPSRSRFMKSNSTPEATAAALAKRKQLIESTIAKNKADAAAAVSTSSTSSSQPQPPGSKSGGGFTPKPSTPIVRQSYTNNDTTSMDFDNDVDMDLGSNRGDTTPIRSRISETRTLPKGDEGQHGISIDEGGSPRKRARGSEPGVRWDDTQEVSISVLMSNAYRDTLTIGLSHSSQYSTPKGQSLCWSTSPPTISRIRAHLKTRFSFTRVHSTSRRDSLTARGCLLRAIHFPGYYFDGPTTNNPRRPQNPILDKHHNRVPYHEPRVLNRTPSSSRTSSGSCRAPIGNPTKEDRRTRGREQGIEAGG